MTNKKNTKREIALTEMTTSMKETKRFGIWYIYNDRLNRMKKANFFSKTQLIAAYNSVNHSNFCILGDYLTVDEPLKLTPGSSLCNPSKKTQIGEFKYEILLHQTKDFIVTSSMLSMSISV